jgi:hypothetical protein
MGRRSVALAFFPVAGLAALLVALVPAPAMADRHTADAGGGGGRAGRSDLKGIVLTGDWVPPGGNFGAVHEGHHEFTVNIAGEFSHMSGDHEYAGRSATLSQDIFQVGSRLTWNRLCHYHCQLYAVGLVGFTIEQNFRDKTSFSLAGGLGADFPFAFDDQLVFRAQQTWNWLDNGTSDNTYGQTSAALVWRFGEHRHLQTKR